MNTIIKNIFEFHIYDKLIYMRTFDDKFKVMTMNLKDIEDIKTDDLISFTQNPQYVRSLRNSEGYQFSGSSLTKLNFHFHEVTLDEIAISRHSNQIHNSLFKLPEEKQILKEWLPDSIKYVNEKYWVNDTTLDLKLIDADAGEIKWIFILPEIVRPRSYNQITNTKKVLGIYKGNLWIQLPDSRILALDLETGKINYEKNHFYFSSIPDGIFLDSKGIILIFHYNVYAEFSLDSMTFSTEKVLGNEKELIIRQVTHHNGDVNLYFTGNKDNSFEPNVYGVFNTDTQTINILKEKEPEMGYFYQAPQVNNEIFAILDEKGNLIIHKRNEM
jgi:hypothetical protein